MSIALRIIKKLVTKSKYCPYSLGEITINDFKETFEMPLDWWSMHDYEQQWKEGLERIKNHETSCLVTRIQNPNMAPFMEWWALYKENNVVFIRNQIFFREYYEQTIGKQSFTIKSCYNFIEPRMCKYLPDNGEISEWVVDLATL